VLNVTRTFVPLWKILTKSPFEKSAVGVTAVELTNVRPVPPLACHDSPPFDGAMVTEGARAPEARLSRTWTENACIRVKQQRTVALPAAST